MIGEFCLSSSEMREEERRERAGGGRLEPERALEKEVLGACRPKPTLLEPILHSDLVVADCT